MKLNNNLKSIYIKTAQKLKGSDRRQFMAQRLKPHVVVKSLGRGGQTTVESELGGNRRTIRKGMQELEKGMAIADSFKLRGRKRIEENLPNLLSDIVSIIEPHSQADPSFIR